MEVREKQIVEIISETMFGHKETKREIAESVVKALTNANIISAWISVEDELPKEAGRYIVKIDIFREAQVRTFLTEFQGWNTRFNITHWMPLPPAPRDKENK